MKMEKEKGKSSARIAVLLALIAIVVAAFSVLPVLVSAAQGVEVRVNAPVYVEGTFNATIDVANVTNLNSLMRTLCGCLSVCQWTWERMVQGT